MNEIIYFTQRSIGKGVAKAWVFKGVCPKCKKGKMGKPIDPKTGKVKIRSKEYVCPECGFSMEKQAHEDTLQCEIKYTCPECGHKGEADVPFKRKSFQGAKAIIFHCGKCNAKIPITKKMK